MKEETVHVIILNWRSAEMTLRSAEAAVAAMEGIGGVISLVDNDSGDGSFEAMSAEAEARGWTRNSRLRVLQSGRNGGFGFGNNAALRVPCDPPSEYVMIVNSDAFLEGDTVRLMRDHMRDNPEIGLLGCQVVGEHGNHHTTHFQFPTAASELEDAARTGPISRLLSRHIVPLPKPDVPGPIGWAAGAALMVRTRVLDQIGGFDETFFLYFEETDLCLRAARAGWPTHYLPGARVMHIGSVSTGMRGWTLPPDYWFASREHFFRQNHGRPYALMATLAHVAGLGVRRLRAAMRPDPTFPKGQTRALLRHAMAPGQSRQIFRPETSRDPA